MAEFQNLIANIEKITNSYVNKLMEIWSEIFPPEVCKEYLRRLLDHVESFYNDLVIETEEKKQFINGEINNLRNEAESLNRLLNTTVKLPSGAPDIPLITLQSGMDKSLQDLRECLRQRREEISELVLQQDALCEELGVTSHSLREDPLPSENEIDDFREYLNELDELRISRINEVTVLRRDIKKYLQILELKTNNDAEDKLLNHHQIKLNEDTLNGLKRMHKCYGAQVEEVRERIDDMRQRLVKLWDRLNTSPDTRSKFLNLNDYNQLTFDIYYNEVQRCEALKRQNMKLYVQQLREQILEWWDKTLKSKVERDRFLNFHNKCYTDDLLMWHELQLDDLQTYYETNQEIFKLFENRKQLWERMSALDNRATAPGRFNNRGGQLLKEEKERKEFATKMPKIEQKITELVKIYEAREHKPFTVYGENIIEYMSNEWAKIRQEKEQRTNARKNAQMKSVTCAPVSSKNTTVVSMKKSSSVTNLTARNCASSIKRKLPKLQNTELTAKRCLMQALNSPSVLQVCPGTTTGKSLKKNSACRNSRQNSGLNKIDYTGISVIEHADDQSDNTSIHRSFIFNSTSGPVFSEHVEEEKQPTEAERLKTLPDPRNLTHFHQTRR